MVKIEDKMYLADSVYVNFDGNGFTVTTENGLPSDPSNEIYFEPETMDALFLWVKQIKDKYANCGG